MVSRSTNSFQSDTRGATVTPNFMMRSCGACGSGDSGARRMDRGGERPVVDIPPRRLLVGRNEVAAARGAIDARVVGAGRPFALVAERAGGEQQAAAGAGDHLVRWREMLEAEIGHRPHALAAGPVLSEDAVDAAVDRLAALCFAVHPPVVALVHRHAPA